MATQVAQVKGQERRICTAPELLLKIVLTGTLSHFETRGMIDEKRLERMLQAGKNILYKSHQESDVRYDSESASNALVDTPAFGLFATLRR